MGMIPDPADCDNASYCLSLQADVRRLTEERDDLLDIVAECVSQACEDDTGELDSMAISTWRDALLLMEKNGRVEVSLRAGRRIIARWKEADDGSPRLPH